MYGYGFGYNVGRKLGITPVIPVFSDDFNRGTLGSDWTLTNTGSSNGVTFDMTGTKARWNCAHTAGTVQKVINNNIKTTQSFSQNYLVLIARHEWTNPNPANAQFEHGFVWNNTNRIYFGNEGATNQNFIRIKINNVNVFSELHPQDLDVVVKIIYDKTNDLVSFYEWNGGAWSVLEEDIDISPYTLPASDPMLIFGAGGESNTRTGGDTGLLDYVYLLDQDISTQTP